MMKTYGETILSLAVHARSAQLAVPAVNVALTVVPESAEERATILYELLDAIDASNADGEVTLGHGLCVKWVHTPADVTSASYVCDLLIS